MCTSILTIVREIITSALTSELTMRIMKFILLANQNSMTLCRSYNTLALPIITMLY